MNGYPVVKPGHEREDFRQLGLTTEGYSGSDIALVARDAIMQPVRALQHATHFKRVGQPPLLTPCSPGDKGALEMAWSDVCEDQLAEARVSYTDVTRSLRLARPSVAAADVAQYAQFTEEFGQYG